MEKNDYGKKHINCFEATIGNMKNKPPGLCTVEAVCGHSLNIESNGDDYACDRYVYEQYKLGNILDTPLQKMAGSNKDFGLYKLVSLEEECLNCNYLKFCFGGCPKDRTLRSSKNYLCEGYKRFYEYFMQSIS